jgi:hypothetical protein
MNPEALDRMIVTKRFGPDFLSSEEFEACLQQARAWFYSELARHWLRSGMPTRSQEFWERQVKGLGDVDETIKVGRFAGSVAKTLLRGAASPLIDVLRTGKRLVGQP